MWEGGGGAKIEGGKREGEGDGEYTGSRVCADSRNRTVQRRGIACWAHAGHMLGTCWAHAGRMLGTCWAWGVEEALALRTLCLKSRPDLP